LKIILINADLDFKYIKNNTVIINNKILMNNINTDSYNYFSE